MYSALHIMQWFSHSLDVFTPKIKRKFFDFYILWIKTNVAYTRLEMIARTKYCATTTASNWFVTLYYKLLPAVRSPSKHGRWRSSLLLYSISMSNTGELHVSLQHAFLNCGFGLYVLVMLHHRFSYSVVWDIWFTRTLETGFPRPGKSWKIVFVFQAWNGHGTLSDKSHVFFKHWFWLSKCRKCIPTTSPFLLYLVQFLNY